MCNPNTDLNLEYLRLLATKATEGYDSEEFVDEISQATRPTSKAFAPVYRAWPGPGSASCPV